MEPFITADEEFIGIERSKAKEIRDSQWWTNRKGNGRCYYCERNFRPADLSMDHKQPIIRGGRSTRNNVVACCKECNTEKGYMLLSEWIQQRQDQGRPLACARHELY